MVKSLQYPKSLLSVEKGISARRRVDLLCMTPGKEGLVPLLLVECKQEEGDSEEQAEAQLLGYNHSIQAPFLALARPGRIKMFWRENGEWRSVPFLPSYPQLVKTLG